MTNFVWECNCGQREFIGDETCYQCGVKYKKVYCGYECYIVANKPYIIKSVGDQFYFNLEEAIEEKERLNLLGYNFKVYSITVNVNGEVPE